MVAVDHGGVAACSGGGVGFGVTLSHNREQEMLLTE